MTIKHLALRRDDTCSVCFAEVHAGAKAWWDNEARVVTCESCHADFGTSTSAPQSPNEDNSTLIERDQSLPEIEPNSPTLHVDTGVAGRSASKKYERLHRAREARIDAKFGRMAGLVKFLTDDPHSITAWKKGSAGERELATSLEQRLADRAILLHDRRVPKSSANIDHVVIAESGVWVVDAKNYAGLVQLRDVGSWLREDNRLYVGRRDCTKLVDGMSWQVDAVRKALSGLDVSVSCAVCFTDAEWKLFAKPFTLKGVFVSGPIALARKISETSQLSGEQVREIAMRLSTALPAKR